MKRKPTSIALNERELEIARFLAFRYRLSISELFRWLCEKAAFPIVDEVNEYLEQEGLEPLEKR